MDYFEFKKNLLNPIQLFATSNDLLYHFDSAFGGECISFKKEKNDNEYLMKLEDFYDFYKETYDFDLFLSKCFIPYFEKLSFFINTNTVDNIFETLTTSFDTSRIVPHFVDDSEKMYPNAITYKLDGVDCDICFRYMITDDISFVISKKFAEEKNLTNKDLFDITRYNTLKNVEHLDEIFKNQRKDNIEI